MQKIFLARQPIVDRKGNLLAFELLFRSADKATAGVMDNTHATAQVMVNAFGELGIEEVLGKYKGFINLDAGFLHSDLVELLPRQQVVIELLETITIDDGVIARCRELKAKGFSLALDDVTELGDEMRRLLDVVDVVKLDLMQIDHAHLPALVKELKRYPVKLLAEKVEDREQARCCIEMGFDMLQGYYFARPEMLSGKRAHPSKMVLLRILMMMMSGAENEEIEEAFKGHADLTYNLMRMVNAAGSGLINRIGSIRQGLMVLGHHPLKRWVQLLLYASGDGEHKVSPLMQLAATRGRLMELIARQIAPHDSGHADRAFMVGMLSLLDTLLCEPLYNILVRVGLEEEVEAALLKGGGNLGKLLALCSEIEAGDATAVQEQLRTHSGLDLAALNKLQLEALAWANGIAV